MMIDKFQSWGLVHQSQKYPWMILAVCVTTGFRPIGMCLNSYQAEGGACLKTFFIGWFLTILQQICIFPGFILFGLPLILALAIAVFALLHANAVMKTSK